MMGPRIGHIGFGEAPVGVVMAFAGKLGAPQPATANPPVIVEIVEIVEAGDHHVTDPIEAWGWMLCDGRSLSKDFYPELFATLGYLYGGSDHSFCIPDYRGYFLRGADAGALVDKDTGTRTKPSGGTAQASGGVGSTQPFAMQTHEHTYLAANKIAAPAQSGTDASMPAGTKTLTMGGPTSDLEKPRVNVSQNETRPSNIYVNYIIKFESGVRAHAW